VHFLHWAPIRLKSSHIIAKYIKCRCSISGYACSPRSVRLIIRSAACHDILDFSVRNIVYANAELVRRAMAFSLYRLR
jgi:hypothetical protein